MQHKLDYDRMSRDELYNEATKRGIRGRSLMNKAELIEVLRSSHF